MADPVAPVVAPATPPGSEAPAAAPGATPPVSTALGAPADPTKIETPADPAKPTTELGTKPEAKPGEAVAFDAAKLTLPEGMKLDDPAFKAFGEVFSDAKLDPQARGQKLIDLYTEQVKGIRQAQVDAWTTTNKAWVDAVKADPEIGGVKFEPTKTVIAKAIDSLGPELSVAFRQGLDVTGAGNHPAIWKGLAKMATLLTEGGHVAGNPASGKPDLASTFFPNSKMQ